MPKSLLSQSPSYQFGPLRRLAITTAITWTALALYFGINHSQGEDPTKLVMPAWVPFWPAFTLPYLGMLLVAWLLPVAIRDARLFCASLRAMIYAFLLVIACWVLIPTELSRPTIPGGWWVTPYRWLAAVDPPRCIMPCGHGIGAVAAAWFLAIDRPSMRWPLVGMLAVGLPSIALVGQHRPVDILIGMVASAIGIAIAEEILRRSQQRR